MRVTILGLGEAGSAYASAFDEAGHAVTGFDPSPVATPPNVTRAASAAEAVSDAEVVFGLTTAAPSVAVASEAAGHLRSEAIYIDMNAGSPQKKREVQSALGSDAKFVDGAVIGSVIQFGARAHVLLSGPYSDLAATVLGTIGAQTESLQGQIGDASQRKLLRSVFMKGLGALITEAIQAGEEAGETEWVRAQIAGELALGEKALDRLLNGTAQHARRRSIELNDSLALLASFPRQWPMTQAAQSVHLTLSRTEEASVAEQLASIPTSALGDAGDRLGFLESAVKPMWKSAPISGRAFTVHTRPGDNLAIHQALPLTQPGDILVVAGGGDCERALIGELIAERAQLRGIAGMVIDGAIRDVDEIEALGFPVWARGVSPAGPYKTGPGRLRETISAAGAVCHHGDFIVADADGVFVVNPLEAEKVLADGRAVVADEEGRKAAMRQEASQQTQ